LRDIVFNNLDGTVVTKEILPKQGITFRNLIHGYLNDSHQYWSKLGIDILLGKPLDKDISNHEAVFLPDYLLKGFDSTTVSGQQLVENKEEILKAMPAENDSSIITPFIVFAALFILIAILSFIKGAKKILSIFDFILFFITGVLGILLLFMWFGTDHPECKKNFNLLWAFPFHFIILFFIYKKRPWVSSYFLGNSALLFLLLISWKWLPQEMNNALIPFVCLLLLRSFVRYKMLRYDG
jgi:hypothetical protein